MLKRDAKLLAEFTLGSCHIAKPVFGSNKGHSRNAEHHAQFHRPLNTAIDINWSKTSSRDDLDGRSLAYFRKAAGRFLRDRGVGGLTCTWARERPTTPVARPNAHLNCHIPSELLQAFGKNVHRFLPRGCVACDPDAIFIQSIGSTGEDYRHRKEYLLKGAHPRARLPITRKRISQGRILRKRCGMSEDIGPSARLRAAERAREKIATIPF